MVQQKIVIGFIFIMLSVVLQLKVESQPTINSFEGNSCPQLEVEEKQSIQFDFEYARQRMKTLEIISHLQSEEIQQIKVELKNKNQSLKILENVSHSQSEEIERLNAELETKQQRLKTLENVSHSQSGENRRLNVELENERQRIKILENVSHSQSGENRRLIVELENERQRIKTLENVSHSQSGENRRLNVELENERRLLQNCLKQQGSCADGFIYLPLVRSCYRVVYESLTWASAGIRCRQQHSRAHLAAITSQDESNALKSFLGLHFATNPSSAVCELKEVPRFGKMLWVSGQRLGENSCTDPFVWKLSNGEQLQFAFTDWQAGEPNCSGNKEQCANLLAGWNYRWNDAPCSSRSCALCEYQPD